jgi:hypothetical protein
LPSGVKVYSSAPPSGLEGTSASSAWLTLSGAPARPSPFTGAMNRLERVWSRQVSQWRTNRPSKLRAETLLAPAASRRDREHLRSRQSPNTSMLSATRSPPGEKPKLPTSSG